MFLSGKGTQRLLSLSTESSPPGSTDAPHSVLLTGGPEPLQKQVLLQTDQFNPQPSPFPTYMVLLAPSVTPWARGWTERRTSPQNLGFCLSGERAARALACTLPGSGGDRADSHFTAWQRAHRLGRRLFLRSLTSGALGLCLPQRGLLASSHASGRVQALGSVRPGLPAWLCYSPAV